MTDRALPRSTLVRHPLVDLVERRYDIEIPVESISHLHTIEEHYRAKRADLIREHGSVGALSLDAYAKATLICEAARMILREIDPKPGRKRRKLGNKTP